MKTHLPFDLAILHPGTCPQRNTGTDRLGREVLSYTAGESAKAQALEQRNLAICLLVKHSHF